MEPWRWQSPPGWPEPPRGWAPPPHWQPDPGWPPAPAGWTWWKPAPLHRWERSTAVTAVVALSLGVQVGVVLTVVASAAAHRGHRGPAWLDGLVPPSSLLDHLSLVLLGFALLALGLVRSLRDSGAGTWRPWRTRRSRHLVRQLRGTAPTDAQDAAAVWQAARDDAGSTGVLLLYAGIACSDAASLTGPGSSGPGWSSALPLLLVLLSAWISVAAVRGARYLAAHPDGP